MYVLVHVRYQKNAYGINKTISLLYYNPFFGVGHLVGSQILFERKIFFNLLFIFLIFIWLRWVLIAARGIFLNCGIQAFSCGMWDLVP